MNPIRRSQRRRSLGLAAATVAVAFLSGCGTDISFSTGAGGQSNSTATSTPTTTEDKPKPEPEEPESSPPLTTTPKTTATPVEEDTEEARDAEPEESQGEIELSVEGRPGVEIFYFKATECSVTDTEVRARGVGIDLSTGEPSEVTILSRPQELLHEGTMTFQASGQVKVTVANEEYISDGRMKVVQGHSMPSMFTYRMYPPNIKYAVSWYAGQAEAGAGYIHVNCDN